MKQEYIDLYDEYTHSATIGRREFLDRLIRLAGGTTAALALLPLLENDYLRAGTVAGDDPQLETGYTEFKAASGKMRGYLARPSKTDAKIPAVLVIHENRGLNPHIEDVARRVARAGFIALAPDALSPLGGTPADQDKAREMIGQLDRQRTIRDFVAAADHVEDLRGSNENVGCVGFCWGGSMANQLAVHADDIKAAVAFYGGQPDPADVPKIRAAVMLHYAELDERINKGIADYEKALKAAGVEHRIHMYEGVNHAFHNDTNAARYDEKAALLAWERTIAFFKEKLFAADDD